MKDLFDFDVTTEEFEPCDHTVPESARPRLSRQCVAILERLRLGPAMNTELALLALKYTSWVSDMRKAGYRIRCTAVDVPAGMFRYELE